MSHDWRPERTPPPALGHGCFVDLVLRAVHA